MKTASLECQIAREQLKRYLGGTKLAPELVRGLERHLASCPECLAMARKGRQPEGGAKPAAKSATKPSGKKGPAIALVDAAKTAAGKPLEKKKANTRSAVLGGMLVLTLGAMGMISRNPEGLLGKRAMIAEAATKTTISNEASEPVAEPVASAVEAAPEPMKGEPMPMAPIETPAITLSPEMQAADETPVETAPVSKPKVTASVQPKKTVSRPANRRPIRRSAPRKSAPAKSDTGSIRVYDASGRPVNPN